MSNDPKAICYHTTPFEPGIPKLIWGRDKSSVIKEFLEMEYLLSFTLYFFYDVSTHSSASIKVESKEIQFNLMEYFQYNKRFHFLR